jgi:taurine dioxygenase
MHNDRREVPQLTLGPRLGEQKFKNHCHPNIPSATPLVRLFPCSLKNVTFYQNKKECYGPRGNPPLLDCCTTTVGSQFGSGKGAVLTEALGKGLLDDGKGMTGLSQSVGPLALRRLSPTLGLEITGQALNEAVRSLSTETLNALLAEYGFLLFPGQTLDEATQAAFAACLGKVRCEGATPRIRYVSNRPVDDAVAILPKGAMDLHVDQCFAEHPNKATLLYGLEIPSKGGATRFADAVAAYAALPQETQALLSGLDVLQAYGGSETTRTATLEANTATWRHPSVIKHPVSGHALLFVNRLMTRSFVGLPEEDSNALLAELFSHLEQPRFRYDHHWRQGDLLVWDNLRLQHGRAEFETSQSRVLRRLTIEGGKVERFVQVPGDQAPGELTDISQQPQS